MCSQITTTVKILWKPSGFSGKVNNKNEKYIFALKLYINYFLKTFGPVLDKDMQSTQKGVGYVSAPDVSAPGPFGARTFFFRFVFM